TMIDTSTTPQTVTLRVHVTDDVAGLAFGDVLWRSPSGSQTKDGYIEPAERVSGTATDGEYAVAVTFPAGSAQGAWTLEGFSLTDRADNQTTGTGLELEAMADLDMTIHQTGASDTTPPAVQSATFAPTPVDDRA